MGNKSDHPWHSGLTLAARFFPRPPVPIRVAALLYGAVGSIGMFGTLRPWLVDGQFVLRPDVLGLPLAIGVYRLRSGWRPVALLFSVVEVLRQSFGLAVGISLLNSSTTRFPEELSEHPTYVQLWWQLLTIAGLAAAFLLLWSNHARQSFVARSKKSGELCLPFILFAGVLLVCRETGSIDLNLRFGSSDFESFSEGPAVQLGAMDCSPPCVVELREPDGQIQYACLVWKETPPSTRKVMASSSELKKYYTWMSKSLAPSVIIDAPNRFIAEIGHIEFGGLYWMPMFKVGTSVVRLSVRGTGRFEKFSFSSERKEKFVILGPCAVSNLRKRYNGLAARKILGTIVDSANRERSSVHLERIQRSRTLRFAEAHALAAHYASLGDEYLRSRNPRDAQRAYRNAIGTLETFLASFRSAPKIRIEPTESTYNVAKRAYHFVPVHKWYVAEMRRYQAVQWELHGERDQALQGYAKAISGFREAMILDPSEIEPPLERRMDMRWTHTESYLSSRVEAHLGLARVRAASGDFSMAVADYEEAFLVSPGNYDVLGERAWLYATALDDRVRDARQALVDAQKACESSSWNDDNYLDTLAAAYAENGIFDEAVKWEKTAIELVEGEQNPTPQDDSEHLHRYSSSKDEANRFSSAKMRLKGGYKPTDPILRLTYLSRSRIVAAETRAARLSDYKERLALYEAGQPFRSAP